MNDIPSPELTNLLRRAVSGDQAAADRAFSVVFTRLRSLARSELRRYPGHTWQSSDLVGEACVRLLGNGNGTEWKDRRHFFQFVAKAMHHLILDEYRKKTAAKRSLTGHRVPLDDIVDSYRESTVDLEALDRGLAELERVDSQMVEIVRLRFFGGMRVAEIVDATGLPKRTVERRLTAARAILREEVVRES